MNRAARIADKAGSGHVWCSQAAWDEASDACSWALQEEPAVVNHALGMFDLKGVSDPMHLVQALLRTAGPRGGH